MLKQWMIGSLALWCWLAPAHAQNLIDGDVVGHQARGDLGAQIEEIGRSSNDRIWVAYTQQFIAGRQFDCGNYGDCRCSLDDTDGYNMSRGETDEPRTITIFVRMNGDQITRFKTIGDVCEIDAKGQTVHFINGVSTESSIDYLSEVVVNSDQRVQSSALGMLANHDHPTVDDLLYTIARGDYPRNLRKNAAFWMSESRGERGFEMLLSLVQDETDRQLRKNLTFAIHHSRHPQAFNTLTRMVQEDPSMDVRKQAVFWLGQEGSPEVLSFFQDLANSDAETEVVKGMLMGLSQMEDDAGLPLLIDIAKTHPGMSVRKNAIFWLGQRASKAAMDAVVDVIDNDPNIGLKKQAVFAISQLPHEEGVPLLKDLALNHEHPTIRKQAIFWLGQTGSKDALAVLEGILTDQ